MKDFQILNKIPRKPLFLFVPLSLLAVFIVLIIAFLAFGLWSKQITVLPSPFNLSNEAKLPIIKTDFVPELSAEGAIVMDADSKVVLFAKNPNLKNSTASTTKIMTALTALDYFKLSDILTVKEATSDGSVLGLLQ